MKTIEVTRRIKAPLEQVFRSVADIREFSNIIPHITNVEFLTKQQYGVGTRFAETRWMKGKEARTELEVTELSENERIRIVADSHGTIWDTLFTTRPDGDDVVLTLVMDANAGGLLGDLKNKLIRGMIVKAIESDMDCVRKHCEE